MDRVNHGERSCAASVLRFQISFSSFLSLALSVRWNSLNVDHSCVHNNMKALSLFYEMCLHSFFCEIWRTVVAIKWKEKSTKCLLLWQKERRKNVHLIKSWMLQKTTTTTTTTQQKKNSPGNEMFITSFYYVSLAVPWQTMINLSLLLLLFFCARLKCKYREKDRQQL